MGYGKNMKKLNEQEMAVAITRIAALKAARPFREKAMMCRVRANYVMRETGQFSDRLYQMAENFDLKAEAAEDGVYMSLAD